MNCPNCGAHYEHNDTFCKDCKTPLGNAVFVPIEKSGKGVFRFFLILFFLAILSVSASFGYYYFLEYSKKECRNDAIQLMDAARNGTLEHYGREQLPENLLDYTSDSNWIDHKLEENYQEHGLDELLSYHEISLDSSSLKNAIFEHSSYKIIKCDASFNKCDITIASSNYNYSNLIRFLKDKLPAIPDSTNTIIGEEKEENESHHWWKGFTDWFHNLTESTDSTENYSDYINEWITQFYENSELQTANCLLHYEWKNGKWTLISADSSLMDCLYGFPTSLE